MSKERPILFSGSMVRAILDGTKTQTRRVLKPQPMEDITQVIHLHAETFAAYIKQKYGQEHEIECPYGQPGDRLWVRECWCHETEFSTATGGFLYRASGDQREIENKKPTDRWRPSIHMPRKASRITLEIVSVRVERLQEISEADAKAEGCRAEFEIDIGTFVRDSKWNPATASTFKLGYKHLWNEINGRESWDANPWVWVVEFSHAN